MKKRIEGYLAYTEAYLEEQESKSELNEKELTECRTALEHHLVQISFFQHERLIHLMIVLLFAALTFAVFGFLIFTFQPLLLLLLFALLVLLIPYIMHYYLLENSVQHMYLQYDRYIRLLDHNPQYLEGVLL